MHHPSREHRSDRHGETVREQVQAWNIKSKLLQERVQWHAPAVEALVIATVWNHIGKKYITEKLHVATKKLEHPTNTGIF